MSTVGAPHNGGVCLGWPCQRLLAGRPALCVAVAPTGVLTLTMRLAVRVLQGLHSVTIRLTILAGTGELSSSVNVPAADVVVTKTISFYKLTSPYADMADRNLVSITTGSNGG